MEQLEYMIDKPWCFGRDNQFNPLEFNSDPWAHVNIYQHMFLYYDYDDHCYPVFGWGW